MPLSESAVHSQRFVRRFIIKDHCAALLLDAELFVIGPRAVSHSCLTETSHVAELFR
jgi:hypothetical protein